VAFVVVLHGDIGCSGKSGQACTPGGERCTCYGNGTCNVGLVCLSDRCVSDPNLPGSDGGPADTGGGTGSGGVAGSGGSDTGGALATGGSGTGGHLNLGGMTGSGGSDTGGVSGAGGSGTGGHLNPGGATSSGGTRIGGATGGVGGSGSGGTAIGGGSLATGGTSTGGHATGAGGASTGGVSTGGAAGSNSSGSGGAGTGGHGGVGSGGAAGAGGGTGGAGSGGAVGAHAFMYGPSLSSCCAESLDVFAVGADGKVRHKQLVVDTWSSWLLVDSASQVITSDIDASQVNFARYDLFGLGTSGNVVHANYSSGAWAATWEDFSFGETAVTPALYGVTTSLVSQLQGWLFTVGSDAKLWERSWNSVVWGPWLHVGGTLSSAPDVVSRPSFSWVVARGIPSTEIVINKNSGNGDSISNWSGFTNLPPLASGAAFSYGPCITAWSDTRLDVFAPGGDPKSLWHNTSTDGGTSWTLSKWEDFGGGPALASSPDCVAWGNGRIDIAAVGADGHVWHRGYEGTLIPWEDLGVY